MIKSYYEALQTRVDSFSLRERAMIFVAISAVLYLLWDNLLMAPVERQQHDILSRIETLRGEISALDQQTGEVMARHNTDPNRDDHRQLAALAQQLQQVDRQISELVSGLIEPNQMARILERVLENQQGLRFIRLENLGREALIDLGSEQGGNNSSGVFRHTMRLELEGNFNQTLAYLRALETLPWQFRWDEVKITMLSYPNANIVIKVHTLSLQEGWLGV